MNDKPSRTLYLPAGVDTAIVDNQRTGVALLDAKLSVRYLNPAAESLLMRSFDQTEGLPVGQMLGINGRVTGMLKRALADQQSVILRQLEITLPDHRSLELDVSATPLPEHAYLLLEMQPLDTQLRLSRDDQLAAQQQTSLQLIRGLAHEVKNPLGGIRGATQLLERELADPELHEYTAIILSEVDRLRDLVDRMMRLRTTPHFEETNVHEVLERVHSLATAEFDAITFVRDYDPSLPALMADRDQLLQACLNVVRNACQALADTPAPEVLLRTRIARQVTASGQRHRSAIRIDIQDNGPGVNPELADRIFFPMISGRAEGTGLGLALTQTIVSEHHGTIECTSQPGRTLFTVVLPLSQPSPVSTAEVASS
ncbi:MAG: PAS domain-containing sensor histidine kinase [Pseudomonadales bacterium]|nr:PAS domain-containing sensor histidine kinase [Pseudomonadales bacterium]